jgi:hypothetical protein
MNIDLSILEEGSSGPALISCRSEVDSWSSYLTVRSIDQLRNSG